MPLRGLCEIRSDDEIGRINHVLGAAASQNG